MNNKIILLDNKFILLKIQITNNYNNIIQLIQEFNHFIYFIKMIKLCEIYKWSNIVNKYKDLKKQIYSEKKSYTFIIKNFQILYKYYTPIVIDEITKKINELKTSHETNIFYMSIMKNEYKSISYKINIYKKNINICKLYNLNNDMKPIINELYILFDKLKDLNKIISEINKKKKNILYKIHHSEYIFNTLADGST
jgi:hypothetical protein